MTGREAPAAVDTGAHNLPWPPYEAKRYEYAARLRDASRIELLVRIALALVVLTSLAGAAWEALHRPRYVADYGVLLSDVAAGRVMLLDPDPDHGVVNHSVPKHLRGYEQALAWRTSRRGWYITTIPKDIDPDAAIRAQPYAKDHPNAPPLGRVPVPSGPWVPWRLFSLPVFAALLAARPQPRLLTRWGWFWLLPTPVGPPAYLLLGGSVSRGTGEPAPRQYTGWHVVAAVTVASLLLLPLRGHAPDLLTPRHAPAGSYVEPPAHP